ncbi:response regulator [Clostridium aminobutyricum]|uniref:Stage 0 sporulation protein A homolog n=1 Tax=Clostridium aminobutyricum TaxID=33953 RepID=A0A939DAU0_CLOAM|nr:response regulator [Clostridium aminobutyricum]MBN7773903.1 response regulator [Clostridium aminobutyricum]
MRTLLIDDERPSLELLKRVISKNENLEIVGEFTDGQEALKQMDVLLPDVIFADIEMPYLNGIRLAAKIKEREDIQVVFVTAYDHYALDAFEVDAANYILKPITEESLNTAVKRLLKYYKPLRSRWEMRKQNKILSLGTFQVYGENSGEPVKWPTLKAKELFAYFLCEKERELDKWYLCDILWPDAMPEKAEHSLHSTMNRMKGALKTAGIETDIQCNKGKYSIDLKNLLWDAEEMRVYFRHNPIATKENVLNFEKVLDIYQGDLFESEGYLWAVERSERTKRRYLEGRAKLAAFHLEYKNYYQAERNLKAILYTEPENEEAVVMLMEVYYLTGNKVQLVHCYKHFKEYLKRELHIGPREATIKTYETFIGKLRK